MSDEIEESRLATIAWEGDSREVLKGFPGGVRQNFGFELWRLQLGERPSDYRPLPSIGAGVYELRDQDERAWYRVVYLDKRRDLCPSLFREEKPRDAEKRFRESKAAAQSGQGALSRRQEA